MECFFPTNSILADTLDALTVVLCSHFPQGVEPR